MAESSPAQSFRRRCGIGAVALFGALLIGPQQIASASAGASPDGLCENGRYYYDITADVPLHMPASGTTYKDGPGGTMTVSVVQEETVESSATVSGGATVSGIVFQTQIEVSATATEATAISVGHEYSQSISAGKYGNMQYGAWGNSVDWKYIHELPDCTLVTQASGTDASISDTEVGWRYWETSS